MRRQPLRRRDRPLLLLAASLPCILSGAPPLLAQQVSPPENVQITVDRQGTALVRELRHVQLVAGENRVRLYDFAPRILPGSVSLRSLAAPDTLRLKEQDFWFEVLDRTRLLESQLGKEIRVLRDEGAATNTYTGRLLLPPEIRGPDGPVQVPLYLEQPDGRVLVVEGGLLDVEAMPAGDFHRPRLDWTVESTRADRHRLEVIYETEGLRWSPHLTVRLDDSGKVADLLCMATVTNDSGRDYPAATLQFQDRGREERGAAVLSRQRPSGTLYPLGRSTDLRAGRSQQFVLGQHTGLTGEARLVLALDVDLDGGHYRAGTGPLLRTLVLANDAAAGLGAPLPPGPMEVRRVDGNNQPMLVTRTEFRGAEPGEPVLLPLGAEPGWMARWHVWPNPSKDGGLRSDVKVHLFNETGTARSVEIWCLRPLGARVEGATPSAEARGPFLVIRADVTPWGNAEVLWSLVSP